MELNRLVRVLQDRWRVIALIAVIGFMSAFGFTTLTNRDTSERWAAQIALRFDLSEGETVEDMTTQIDNTRGLAVLAAGNLLADYENATIYADAQSGRLYFRAEANTQEEARQRAENLVLAYKNSDQGGGDIESQLNALVADAAEVKQGIAELEVTHTPAEQELLKRHEIIDQSIAAVSDSLVGLSVADAGASAEEQTANALARENLNERLTVLFGQKAELAPPPDTELSVADQFLLSAKQRQLEVIGLEYERLSLRSAGVLGDNVTEELPTFSSLTPPDADPMRNGLVGFIAGVALAGFAVVFVARSRKEVWVAEDLPIPVLGEVPDRKPTTQPGPSWYDSTQAGRRKEAIQTARTVIESSLPGSGASFAVAGDGLSAASRHALAVDLAGAFASAGRHVLLVNGDFSGHVEMTEYETGEPTLSSVLRASSTGAAGVEAKIGQLVDDTVHIRSGLAIMPAGQSPESPADTLAGPRFRLFLDIARERFDLVITVGSDADSAASQVLMQRTGMAIVAVAPGGTTIPRVDSLLFDLSQQRVALPGAIMLHGKDRLVGLPTRSASSRQEPSREVAVQTQEPISRLDFYPFPGSKRASSGEASLANLTDRLSGEVSSVANGGNSVGADIVQALAVVDAVRAVEPVARYVVARVEDIMTAVPGQDGVSAELIEVVRSDGYIPLTPVRGLPTMGERLVAELEIELGDESGASVAESMAKILTGSNYMNPAASIDAWLKREFFKRHVANTEREPTVWHLTSPEGSVQVVVNGKRLTDERLGALTSQVVRRVIADNESEVTAAIERDDEQSLSRLEAALKDAHLLEVSLGVLRGGSSDDARLSYPWRKADSRPAGWNPIWSEGIRANIAPLQRLGLLPYSVLTESELGELTPV